MDHERVRDIPAPIYSPPSFLLCCTPPFKSRVCISFPAQVEAGSTLKDVSESLLILNSEDDEDDQKRHDAARYLFNAVNNVFEATVQNGTGVASAPETVQVGVFFLYRSP